MKELNADKIAGILTASMALLQAVTAWQWQVKIIGIPAWMIVAFLFIVALFLWLRERFHSKKYRSSFAGGIFDYDEIRNLIGKKRYRDVDWNIYSVHSRPRYKYLTHENKPIRSRIEISRKPFCPKCGVEIEESERYILYIANKYKWWCPNCNFATKSKVPIHKVYGYVHNIVRNNM